MNRVETPSPISPETIKIAVHAYEAGHRLLSSWINECLSGWRIDLRIKVKTPYEGITMEQCRRALANCLNAYRPYSAELLPEKDLQPWLIYMINRDNGKYEGAGVTLQDQCFAGHNWTDEQYYRSEINRIFGVKHGYGWREPQFKEHVVDCVRDNAKHWLSWLRPGRSPWAGQAPEAESEQVQLFGPSEAPIVRGKRKKKLTPGRYEVIHALIIAGFRGLAKDELEEEHSSARSMLKKLAAGDPDWAKVLVFADVKDGRYRIR